ncbi:hypothetical protein CAP35_03175 [Chitinophagaceae bacterium IBVUCB1]|nr:hypothetical protein CAP35_03175 [Chitinophagaceae bacterium IBVUCB1]
MRQRRKIKCIDSVLLIASIISIVLIGCKVNPDSLKVNNDINTTDRDVINSKINIIKKAILRKESSKILELYDASNANNLRRLSIDSLVTKVDLDSLFQDKQVLEIRTTVDNVVGIVESKFEDDDFEFNIIKLKNDGYTKLIAIKDQSNKNEWLITAVFEKNKSDWGLLFVTSKYIKADGLSAIDAYEISKAFQRKNNSIAAVYYAMLSVRLLYPCLDYFHYVKEDSVLQYAKSIISSIKSIYEFPLEIRNLNSISSIITFEPEVLNGELQVLVVLNSPTDLSDNSLLDIEVNEIHKKINTLLPGISDIGKKMHYRVVSNSDKLKYKDFVRQ